MTTSTVTITKHFSWLGLLGVIFVICKIFEIGVIATWSWWLVLLPFYIGLAIILGLMFGGAALVGLAFFGAIGIDKFNRWRKRRAYQKRFK